MSAEPPLMPSRVSLKLDLPPTSLQFCPEHSSYFVVGTYDLQKEDNQTADTGSDDGEDSAPKKPQTRNGTILLFKVDNDHPTLVQTLPTSAAVLDLRWHPTRGVLGVITSTAELSIFRFRSSTDSPLQLEELVTSACTESDELEPGVLFLQFQWHPLLPNRIFVTTSNGLPRLLILNENWAIETTYDLSPRNMLEAWSIAISPPSTEPYLTVYCGGDDSILRYATYRFRDSKLVDDEQDSSDLGHYLDFRDIYQAEIGRQHDAGVTAILPLSQKTAQGGRLVLTGSYDDHVRLFAVHDLNETYGARQVKLLVDKNLDGGVWRLDLIEANDSNIRILASCMHAGVRVLEFRRQTDEWECTVLARFEEHKSMNYASDFARSSDISKLQVVSTSFYDKLLCLWECQLA